MYDQNLRTRMATMSPQQLKQFAMMHKDDPFVVSMALDIDNTRKAGQRQQAMQAAQQPQPKVVDQTLASIGQAEMPPQAMQAAPQMQAGLPQVPAQNIANMADGGIAGYAKGGETNELEQYVPQIVAEAKRLGIDPNLALRLFKTESEGKKGAVSPKGAAGLGQLMKPAAKEMGISEEERFDPEKNITASLGYLKKQLDKYKDPVKAVAAYNWGPGNVDKHLAKNQGAINPIGLPKETANYITKLIPIAAANAAEERPTAKAGEFFPSSMLNPNIGKTLPKTKEGKAAPVATSYDYVDPMGNIVSAPPSAGQTSTTNVAAQLAGLADIVPKALYGLGTTASENVLALPFGKEVPTEKRRATAQQIMAPFYKYGTVGGITGLANDPAYASDPASQLLNVVQNNLEKSDEAIAAMTGAKPDNVRLVRENVMAALPLAGKIKPVETGMPKLPGKGKPNITADAAAAEAAVQAQRAAEAEAKIAAPRLAAPTTETPGVIRQTPTGEGVLPTGSAAAAEKSGLAALIEDKNAANMARKSATAAEELALASRAAEAETAAGAARSNKLSNAGKTAAAISSAGVGLQEPTDLYSRLTTPKATPHVAYSEEPGYDFGKKAGIDTIPAPTDKTTSTTPEKKTGFGALSDEDYLMMGLNMLQAPAGLSGGMLSQLGQNIGRSGLATLGAKREREKTLADQLQKQALSDYYKGMTKNLDREPETIRQLRALQSDPKLMDTMMQMEAGKDIAGQRARLLQAYDTAVMMGTIDPATMSREQFLQQYGGSSLGGNTNLFKVVGSRPS